MYIAQSLFTSKNLKTTSVPAQ